MFTAKDLTDIDRTKAVIRHVRDVETGSAPINRIPLGTVLDILDFILTGVRMLMYDKAGNPKNRFQLIGSIFQIISFIRDVVRRITGDVSKSRIGQTIEARTIAAITRAVKTDQ